MNATPKIGVFFQNTAPEGSPFHVSEYRRAYQELAAEASRQGAGLYIVRGASSYLGQGLFSDSWQFSGQDLIHTGPVTLAALYDKDRFFQLGHADLPLFNPARLSERCIHKSWILEQFPAYCPRTFLVENAAELVEKAPLLQADRLIIKPPSGAEGTDIQVLKRANLKTANITYPCLIQDFLDSSAGIPGIETGIHDLRIAFFNGQPLYSFVRTPPPNSLIANVAQGGSLTLLSVDQIPKKALDLAHTVDKKMQDITPRLYSVDMMLTRHGWRLIELESSLGLQENARGDIFSQVKKQIITALCALASS